MTSLRAKQSNLCDGVRQPYAPSPSGIHIREALVKNAVWSMLSDITMETRGRVKQNANGFEVCDYLWEWPWPSPDGPDLIPRSVGVLFKCPRCTHRSIVTVATDPEGRIVFYVKDLADHDVPTGNEVVSWLDLPPQS
jgi:hypothetical protein